MINHPDRVLLHNEVHARPRPSVVAPHRVSHVALLRPRDSADPPAALLQLCADHRLAPPAPGQRHFFGDCTTFRLKWERHGEFDDYTVYRSGVDPERPFADPAIEALPRGWLETLPGETIAAVHVSVLTDDPRWQDSDAAGRAPWRAPKCSARASATARAPRTPTCAWAPTVSRASCCWTAR